MASADERAQIARIGRALDRAVERAVANVTRAVHAELVAGTPRDTGNLAHNWIPAIGAPFNSGPRPLGHVGARLGAAATAAGLASLPGYRLAHGPAFVANRTGYAADNLLDDRPDFMEEAIGRAIRAAERGG